ncbi:MAG: rod shape-determining protein [Firmicutes bacterium HGW-Firmicutes-1]|jgi:rod shape-determining protein MreB|nr:MAG: rod shape-determining protein [Firmicutes bacterium HGW-Firmicutes-1]
MIFKRDFGFDLGTTYMHICQKDKGVILNEPEAIAIDLISKNVIAVGDMAFDMYEKAPKSIKINMPVKYGVIADFDNMLSLLDYQCKNLKIDKGSRPTALVCVPYHISEVERRALYDLFTKSRPRFKSVFMLEKPLAAGIGCGIDVMEPVGNMIVDIGGGTTEISVISLGGVVNSELIKVGGERFDNNIRNLVKRNHNVLIGLRTAERIKIEIGNAIGNDISQSIEVVGRDIVSGLPKTVEITSNEVHEAMKEEINSIIDAIKLILEKTPPELSADILSSGIHVTGGTASIKNLDRLISKETNLEVFINDNPAKCVINGVCNILNNYNKHKNILFTLKE